MKVHERAGYTMAEVLIGFIVFLVIMAGFTATLSDLNSVTRRTDVETRMQEMGVRATKRIVEDIRQSGVATIGGLDFPHVFDRGVPGPGFEINGHAAAEKEAVAGDPDFGLDRAIVFVRPADDDADGVPDVDIGAGELIWDASHFSYVLVTRADGINYLEQRTNGVLARTIASNLERVVFDDAASSGFVVPLGCVRIRLFFRMLVEGLPHRHFVETTIRLRNT